MSDLVEFLRARLGEEEEAARAAIAERVRVSRDGEEPDWRFAYWPDLGAPAVVVGGERVLADVEAKRRIVEREVNSLTPTTWRRELVLRDLASVYAQHPDYEESWRR